MSEDDGLPDPGRCARPVDLEVIELRDQRVMAEHSSPLAGWESFSASLEVAVNCREPDLGHLGTRLVRAHGLQLACTGRHPAPFAPPTSPTDTPRWLSSTSRRR